MTQHLPKHLLWMAGLILAATTATAPAQEVAQTTIPALGSARHVVIPQTRSWALAPSTPGITIEAVKAHVTVREQTARTVLEIALRNTNTARQEEAVILLPVPDGAVVTGFAFDGESSEPTAQILNADDARRLYDQIVTRLMDPALLEFAGYNVIRSSVFPVPPGAEQRVRLTYEHLLPSDGDRIDYVLPRSEALTRRRPWQVEVQIESAHAVSTVYSPSHEVDVVRTGPGSLSATLAPQAQAEPGAFRLSYLLDRGGITGSIFAYPDPSRGGGFFLFMAGLPVDRPAVTVSREVTLVLDRSGSMAGIKMDQVRAATLQVIEGLEDGEAFNIIDYGTTVESFADAPVVKNRESIEAARAYLHRLRPGGGTNLHDALLESLRPAPHDGMLPLVLFLTDGLPTIGQTSEVAIRTLVEDANPHGRRVFTFGVGGDVNVPLLDRVADVTRATTTYVMPDEDVELKVAQVFRRLSGPVLAEPALAVMTTDGAVAQRRLREIMPTRLPDMFDGDQLIVLGQYTGEQPMALRVSGEYFGESRSFTVPFDPSRATTRNAFVPRLWASRRIGILIDQIRQDGAASALTPAVVGTSALDNPRHAELIDEIVSLSTEFGILTEYTAFFATEGTDLTNTEELVFGCRNELDMKAVRTRSGLSAVTQGLNNWSQKGQVVLNSSNRYWNANHQAVEFVGVQQVCDRAFFRRGNRWIDSRLLAIHDKVEPHEILVLGSPDHTALLQRFVLEGRQGVLSLAGEILLAVDGRIVLITDGC